jgi:hypothetical protein
MGAAPLAEKRPMRLQVKIGDQRLGSGIHEYLLI